MITYIINSLLNGVCISLSRSMNGRLSMERNAFYASLWNHIVGFIFLSLILFVQRDDMTSFHFNAPWYAYSGGAMGALFVAVNSYILPRLGSTQRRCWSSAGKWSRGWLQTIWVTLMLCYGFSSSPSWLLYRASGFQTFRCKKNTSNRDWK